MLSAALMLHIPIHSRLRRIKHPFYHINIVQCLNENVANNAGPPK
jgi:hypothetical protein